MIKIEEHKTYCLGTGCMRKCDTCRNDEAWQELNQLPDALRKSIQGRMLRIDESRCQITSGRFYVPKL